MILNSHTISWAKEGEEGAIHTLLLYAGHGAYGFGECKDGGPNWLKYFEVETVWDSYQFSELWVRAEGIEGGESSERHHDEVVRAAFDLIFADLRSRDDWDAELDEAKEWGSLVTLKGGQTGLCRAWSQLAESLDPRGKGEYEVLSGDDDAFDYWPSGLRLLISLTNDLKALWPRGIDPDHHADMDETVAEIIKAAIEKLGENAGEVFGPNGEFA